MKKFLGLDGLKALLRGFRALEDAFIEKLSDHEERLSNVETGMESLPTPSDLLANSSFLSDLGVNATFGRSLADNSYFYTSLIAGGFNSALAVNSNFIDVLGASNSRLIDRLSSSLPYNNMFQQCLSTNSGFIAALASGGLATNSGFVAALASGGLARNSGFIAALASGGLATNSVFIAALASGGLVRNSGFVYELARSSSFIQLLSGNPGIGESLGASSGYLVRHLCVSLPYNSSFVSGLSVSLSSSSDFISNLASGGLATNSGFIAALATGGLAEDKNFISTLTANETFKTLLASRLSDTMGGDISNLVSRVKSLENRVGAGGVSTNNV